jgi:hypothetical protein
MNTFLNALKGHDFHNRRSPTCGREYGDVHCLQRQDLTATDRVVLPFRQRSPGLALSAGRRPAVMKIMPFQGIQECIHLLYVIYFACLNAGKGSYFRRKRKLPTTTQAGLRMRHRG